MLRPATPLAIMSFAAFVLLLLSVLSTPIIHAIPLGTYEGVDFGVFGFCEGDDCSPIEIGYDTGKLPIKRPACNLGLWLCTHISQEPNFQVRNLLHSIFLIQQERLFQPS